VSVYARTQSTQRVEALDEEEFQRFQRKYRILLNYNGFRKNIEKKWDFPCFLLWTMMQLLASEGFIDIQSGKES
jgi:hypothetical protein